MKLSLVIPAYNEEALLGRCLDSIKREIEITPGDFEIIVVNNGSTDRTREVALARQGVKVIEENNRGLTFARQAGYLASSGELIANVDADNILPAGWIKVVLDEFAKDEKLVALSGPLIFYDMPAWTRLVVKVFYRIGCILNFLSWLFFRTGGLLQGGNFVVKRTALEAVGGFNTKIIFFGEDTDIARRLRQLGHVKFTFHLPIYSSGRRLKKEGIFYTGWRYALNYIWILFFKKPYRNTKAAAVRTDAEK